MDRNCLSIVMGLQGNLAKHINPGTSKTSLKPKIHESLFAFAISCEEFETITWCFGGYLLNTTQAKVCLRKGLKSCFKAAETGILIRSRKPRQNSIQTAFARL